MKTNINSSTGKSAEWTAPQMRITDDWQLCLSQTHIDEICAATEQSRDSGVAIAALGRDSFNLPTLGSTLQQIHKELLHGRGFVLVRGMPVDQLDRESIIRACVGVSAWLGQPVSQNGHGHLVGHVKDLGNDPLDPATRIYTTAYRQPFHTDSCDIVALLCLQPALSGGQSAIASSTSIYRHMQQHCPELAEQLRKPYIYDRKGEVPAGKQPVYPMPVVHEYENYISVIYARDFIDAALTRFPDLAAQMSSLQLEALDEFDRLAHSDQFKLEMDFRPGDIQYLHNHQILHARTTYEDHPDPAKKRHLIRLWLSAHNPRPLPVAYEERYGPIHKGQIRGGIRVPGVALSTPLDATPASAGQG